MNREEAYVKLDKVSKIYKMGEVEIRAVDEISFEIAKGEFVVIVGPSGAGKTTVLNILGGMDTASRGLVQVDGRNITAYNSRQLTAYRRDDIGFVFQFYNLVPNLTALENVELAMQICKNPSQFDVIVTENMFGDILSDEASEITGSIGMVPSSSLGAGACGLYEPIHGSAPDIAGQDMVNPIACILSAAMMLRYSFDMATEADEIEAAVNAVLDKGLRTADMMSEGCTRVGCAAMGSAIIAEL